MARSVVDLNEACVEFVRKRCLLSLDTNGLALLLSCH